jgi:integrase
MRLGNSKLELSYVFKDFHKQVDAFKEEIARESIAVFIATWADIARKDTAYGVEHLKMMCDLIERKLLPLVVLRDFARVDLSSLLENIRSFEEWTISKREEIILLFTSFVFWLSKETFGYVPEAVDPDRVVSQKRQVSFKTYIDILERLDLRERILAKMFYLGGSRGLEEVLSVKIEDVDFKKNSIRFAEEVSYPRHLFEDIKKYIQDRKKGYLFVGKEGERISHTTPFRALKKIAVDLKLDPDFTFKELTK